MIKKAHHLISSDLTLLFVAWPYANAPIHLGHVAGTFLPADIHRRFLIYQLDHEVYSISGSDEYGTPILQTAQFLNQKPEIIASANHHRTLELLKILDCLPSIFSRTSRPFHAEFVNKFFQKLLQTDRCYRCTTERPWCETCEKFLTDREIRGECPKCHEPAAYSDQCEACGYRPTIEELSTYRCYVCQQFPIFRPQDEYRFRLSREQERLKDFLPKDGSLWRTDAIHTSQSFLKQQLEDLAISRVMNYGVPIFKDPSMVFYVWFEALLGYESVLQEHYPDLFLAYHEQAIEAIFFLGKDNILFHSIIYPGMLLGYHDELPLMTICSSQFLTMGHQKLSKSKMNIHDLPHLLNRFQPDLIRFVLSIRLPETHDSNLEDEDFETIIDDLLIDTILNYQHRVVSLFHQLTVHHTASAYQMFITDEPLITEYVESMKQLKHTKALDVVLRLSKQRNQHLSSFEPWKLSKTNPAEAILFLQQELGYIIILASMLEPFIPTLAEQIFDLLRHHRVKLTESIAFQFEKNLFKDKPGPLLEHVGTRKIKFK